MVDQKGDIWPCHRFDGAAKSVGQEADWALGNIFRGFNHDLHDKMLRQDEWLDRTRCRDCALNCICRGGCLAENLGETGRPALPRENVCRLYTEMKQMMSEKVARLQRLRSAKVRQFLSDLEEGPSPKLNLSNREQATVRHKESTANEA